MAQAYRRAEQNDLAIKDFSAAIALDPNNPICFYDRARAYISVRQFDRAIADYIAATELDPKDPLYVNDLAWLFATCPVAEVRNGKGAVELATKACELTNWRNALYIDTLATAYAESGDFESAIKWQEKTIDLLGYPERTKYLSEFKERLKLYQSGKPYREDL